MKFQRAVSRALIAAMVAVLMLLTGCGPDDSPEEQVRKFIKAGEEALESRNIGDVKSLIAEEYADDRGRGRRDLVALTARYLFMHKNIHLLTRTDNLSFPAPDQARLTVFVAMTGRNVSDLDSLLNMQADLYRFELELVKRDGDWQLVQAAWRPARGEDFF